MSRVRCIIGNDNRIKMDLEDFKAVLVKGQAETLKTLSALDCNDVRLKKLRIEQATEISCLGDVITLLDKYTMQLGG